MTKKPETINEEAFDLHKMDIDEVMSLYRNYISMTSRMSDNTKETNTDGKILYCSFCGKGQNEVRKLIAGPSVFICEECVDLCNNIIDEELSEAFSGEVLNFYLSGRQFIHHDFIDDLIQGADITEVIGRRLEMKKAGNEYRAICPFFHGDTKPFLTIVPQKGFYHCFSCQVHGTALDFLMEHENLSFIEAVEELAKIAGIEIPKTKQARATNKKNKSLQELTAEIMDQFIQHLSKYKERVLEKIASELKMKVSQLKTIQTQVKMSNSQRNYKNGELID